MMKLCLYENHTRTNYVYVVLNFLSQVIIVSLLFWGMVMYANEVENKRKIKIT